MTYRNYGARFIVILIIFSMLILSGCTSDRVVSNEVDNKKYELTDKQVNSQQQGFVYHDDTEAMFIQWTETDKQITGQLQLTYPTKSENHHVKGINQPFTGVINGKNISITFKVSGTVTTGTLEDNKLSLVVPNEDGTLKTMEFNPGSVEDYNKWVVEMQNGVQQRNNQEQEEKARQEQKAAEAERISNQQIAVTKANEDLAKALKLLSNATQDLVLESSHFDGVLKSYEKDWEEMQNSYKKMMNESKKKPMDSYQLSSVRYELDGVKYYLSGIEYDAKTMESEVEDVNKSISSVTESIAKVQFAWEGLQQAVKVNVTGTPSSQFDSDYIVQAVTKAQKQIELSTTAVKSAKEKAGLYDSKAKKVYLNAEKFVEDLKPIE